MVGTASNYSTLQTAATASPPTLTIGDAMSTVIANFDGTNGITIGSTDSTGAATLPTSIDDAINVIDYALTKVNDARADYGALQNRFDAVIKNLQVNVENQSAARGRIMDADFASETANLSRSQVLQQAGNAMVAQANQLPQQVLKLLQG
jgi:flagellin